MSVVANVAINVDSRGATQKLREVQLGARATEKAFGALTQAAAAFGTGFAISRVIADVKELDTNLRRLATVGGNVSALDKGLGQLSKNLDGIANKAELAAASYQALSAGFTETGANLKVVEAATKAAVGGLVDVTSVVEVTTKTLNAYGLSGNQAIKVTDSISKAIEYGQVQWSDYTSQLGRVAATAALAGVSIDEINAFVAAATKNGATAEVAFTGLSAALATLLKPTKESQDAAAQLGIAWNIGGLQAKGFSGLLEELSKKQDTNKTAVAELLGSQEALRGVLAANSKAGKDYQMILEGLGGAAGKTDKDFQTMKDSLDNQLKALDTAFKNLSEALGKAFGPAVVDSISDITGVINGFADAINATPKPVLDAAAAIAKAVVQVLLLQKAIQGILALRAALLGMFAATATGATTAAGATASLNMNMRYLQGSMATAQTQASGLVGVLRNLAAFGVITVGINLVVTGLQEAMAAAAETRRLRGERAAGGAASIYGGSATAQQKATAKQTLEAVRREQQRYRQPGTIAAQTVLGPASQLFGIPTTAQAGARRTVLAERAIRAQATMGLPTRTEAGLPKPTPTPQSPTPSEDKAGSKKKTDAERLAEEIAKQKAAAAELLAVEKGRLQVAETADPIHQKITAAVVRQNDIQREYAAKLNEAKSAEETLNLQMAERNALQTNALELQAALTQEIEQITQPLDELSKAATERLEFEKKYQELLAQGINPELAKEYAQIELAAEKQKELLTLRIADLEAAKAKLNAESDIAKKLQEQIDHMRELLKLQPGQAAQAKQETEAEQRERKAREKREADAKEQAERLKNLYRGVVNTLEDGIVGSLTAGVEALFDKTKSLAEALQEIAAGVLKDIGQMLLRFAVNAAMRGAFPGAFAAEGAYWSGGFKAFANGGMVTRPTMGLIGEGGEPEYVIPSSKMRGAMNRYASGARGSSVIPQNGDGAMAGGGGSFTLETVVINNVEYATVDQVRAMGQQAASQGAQGGFNKSMRTLQNSRSQRARIGLR